MNALWRRLSLAAVVSLVASAAQAQVISATVSGYDLVKVGNQGNAADSGHANRTGFGAVNYDFWIGKNDVTIGQYVDFLNAVAKTDTYNLYNSNMGSVGYVRGISRTGTSGNYSYSAIAPDGTNPVGAQSAANRPITYVSWLDAARFANWMANGKTTGAQDNTTTERGAYNLNGYTGGNITLQGITLNAINPNTGAAPTFSIPTENEWYKAAYYSPIKGGPSTPGYYLFGTESDAEPGNGGAYQSPNIPLSIKGNANQSNSRRSNYYAVTGTTAPSTSQNLLTDVGTFTASDSYYGAFDMTGNVDNWSTANGTTSTNGVIVRGSSWDGPAGGSTTRTSSRGATDERNNLGFRLASPVPEPATLGMASAGILIGGYMLFKRRRWARA